MYPGYNLTSPYLETSGLALSPHSPTLAYSSLPFTFSLFGCVAVPRAAKRKIRGVVPPFGPICNLAIYACVLGLGEARRDATHFFIYLPLRGCVVFAGSIGTEWIRKVEWKTYARRIEFIRYSSYIKCGFVCVCVCVGRKGFLEYELMLMD